MKTKNMVNLTSSKKKKELLLPIAATILFFISVYSFSYSLHRADNFRLFMDGLVVILWGTLTTDCWIGFSKQRRQSRSIACLEKK